MASRQTAPAANTRPKTRVAVVGTGLAGLTTAYLLQNDSQARFEVVLFEQGETLSLDAASVTLRNASTGITERVNIPSRSVTRGYYPNLTRMYDFLHIPLRTVRYAFLYAEIPPPSEPSKPGPPSPQSTDQTAGTYFAHDNLHAPVLPARLRRRGLPQLWQALFLAACQLWFLAACFLVAPRGGGGESLRAYLRRTRVPRRFVDRHLLPVLGAICTCSHGELLAFPASDVVGFMTRSSLRTTYVTDGVHELQAKLARGVADVRLRTRVRAVERVAGGGVLVRWQRGATAAEAEEEEEEVFDRVVLAVAPNAAAGMFAPARRALAAIPTASNQATVIDPSYKRVSVEEGRGRTPPPAGRLLSRPRVMAFRTRFGEKEEGENGDAQTEAWDYLPTGAICRTSPYEYAEERGAVLHRARFTRTLRTTESRSIVERVVGGDRGGETEAWVSGRDNVWVAGSWCWDGMVLLEGCVVSAMRVADEFGVEVPWREG